MYRMPTICRVDLRVVFPLTPNTPNITEIRYSSTARTPNLFSSQWRRVTKGINVRAGLLLSHSDDLRVTFQRAYHLRRKSYDSRNTNYTPRSL